MKNYGRIIGILLAAIVCIMSIFVSTQIPIVNPKITDLPIAVVNNDKTDTTKVMVEKLKENSQVNDKVSIKWEEVSTKDEAVDKMNNGEYYGALVIPENYEKSVASLATPNAKAPEFTIVINQGKNSQLSTQVTQILTQMANKSGDVASLQIIKKAEAANKPLPAKIVENLMKPVMVNVEYINTTGDFSSAPGVFFSPLWISSLIGSVLLLTLGCKESYTAKGRLLDKLIRLGFIAVISIVIGFLAPNLVNWILGVSVENYTQTAWFLTIGAFAFMTLIFGTISWLGIVGAPLFVLMLFFGLPILSLAPEMLGSFYTQWILPWLPMRMLYDGIKNMLFFNQGLWNSGTKDLVVVATVGVILILSSVLKKSKVSK